MATLTQNPAESRIRTFPSATDAELHIKIRLSRRQAAQGPRKSQAEYEKARIVSLLVSHDIETAEKWFNAAVSSGRLTRAEGAKTILEGIRLLIEQDSVRHAALAVARLEVTDHQLDGVIDTIVARDATVRVARPALSSGRSSAVPEARRFSQPLEAESHITSRVRKSEKLFLSSKITSLMASRNLVLAEKAFAEAVKTRVLTRHEAVEAALHGVKLLIDQDSTYHAALSVSRLEITADQLDRVIGGDAAGAQIVPFAPKVRNEFMQERRVA